MKQYLVFLTCILYICQLSQGQTLQGLHIKSDRDSSKYCADEVGIIKCNRSNKHSWETFTFIYNPAQKKYRIKGGQGKYCHGRGGNFKCDEPTLSESQDLYWVKEDKGNGKSALKNSATGKYLVAEAQNKKVLWWWELDYYYLKCNRDAAGPWELFHLGF